MDIKMVLDYLDKIDAAYGEGKQKRWSRYGKEWSGFSTSMNKEVRQKIKDGVKEEPLLQIILPYWFNKSEMLEIHYTKKHKIKRGKLNRLKKQCNEFRKDIENGRTDKHSNLSALDIARMSIEGAI